MSEQKPTSFMQELDLWTETNVIDPLLGNDDEPDDYVGGEAIERIQRAIRTKVLESFRNGQAAGPKAPRPARKEWHRHVEAQTR